MSRSSRIEVSNDISPTSTASFSDVFDLAFYITQRDYRSYIINIGTPNLELLRKFSVPFNIINISHIPINNLGEDMHVENIITDYVRFPHIEDDILKNSVVISTGVYGSIPHRKKYLKYLSKISKKAPFVLISEKDKVSTLGLGVNEGVSYEEAARDFKKASIGGDLGWTRSDSKEKDSFLYISGSRNDKNNKPISIKKVTAIMTCYNEKDIIGPSIHHLLDEGCFVHVVDNWSDDGTFEKVQQISDNERGKVTYERFPEVRPNKHVYKWTELLQRVQAIASSSKSDWVMHNDADELRLSPWRNVKLREAINIIDNLGYDAIDFTVADFRPTSDGYDETKSLISYFTHFELSDKGGYSTQIKCWKTTDKVDIVRTGGHHAEFPSQHIYPLKGFTQHFPIRSNKQGNKKIFKERKKSFDKEERSKGWHVQYDQYSHEQDFVWSPGVLYRNSPGVIYENIFVERVSGVGIAKSEGEKT